MNTNTLEVLQGDLTKISVDAIVNAANSSLMGGGGVDGAIHRAGGPAILEECKKIVARQGGCKTGEAVITTGGKLPAKFVIHTVGPVWNGGHNNEAALLANCYKNSLQVAIDNSCKTIAFPNISTGIFRFPKKDAAKIAVESVRKFIDETSDVVGEKRQQRRIGIEKVLFVCFDEESFQLVKKEVEKYKI